MFSLRLAFALTLFSFNTAWSAPAVAVCDVCREGEEPVAAQIPHGDHTHSFCSAGCADRYRAAPEQYHTKAAPPPPVCKPAPASSGSAAPSCPI